MNNKIDTEKEYTISEVSKITGYPNHVLRYYEKEFKLDIPRNEANHRYYTFKEIETINYIKALQEKGFTNKQINLIMNSPEMLINNNETAVTSLTSKKKEIRNISKDISNEIYIALEKIINNSIKPKLIDNSEKNFQAINDLKNEIIELRNEINSKERDVLICENAKLKMKIKEKTYEIVELKEKLKKEQKNNAGFIKKIFRKKI